MRIIIFSESADIQPRTTKLAQLTSQHPIKPAQSTSQDHFVHEACRKYGPVLLRTSKQVPLRSTNYFPVPLRRSAKLAQITSCCKGSKVLPKTISYTQKVRPSISSYCESASLWEAQITSVPLRRAKEFAQSTS